MLVGFDGCCKIDLKARSVMVGNICFFESELVELLGAEVNAEFFFDMYNALVWGREICSDSKFLATYIEKYGSTVLGKKGNTLVTLLLEYDRFVNKYSDQYLKFKNKILSNIR